MNVSRRQIREAARLLAARRKRAGRKKVLRPCPTCGQKFGAREMREHLPSCPSRVR